MAKIKRLWNYLMPFATDSTGVCSLFCDSDSLVIGMDPGATALRCYPFTEKRSDQKADYRGIRIGELDVIMGKMDEMTDHLCRFIEREKYRQIILVGTPVASLLGMDLKGLAGKLEKLSGHRVIGIQTTGNRYYDEGFSEAFRMIYQRIQKERAYSSAIHRSADGGEMKTDFPGASSDLSGLHLKSAGKKVNLLGLNTLDYPDMEDRNALLEHVQNSSLQVNSIWGIQSDWESWARAPEADWNIVCSSSGYRLAEIMKKQVHIPYVSLDGFLEQTDGFNVLFKKTEVPQDAQSILIVGEQITSNILRRVVETREGFHEQRQKEITVAGFFMMDSKFMRPGDRQLRSEAELDDLLSENRYDLVIGDPMYRLLTHPEQNYLVRNHPPVSGGFAGQFSL